MSKAPSGEGGLRAEKAAVAEGDGGWPPRGPRPPAAARRADTARPVSAGVNGSPAREFIRLRWLPGPGFEKGLGK